LQKALQFLPFYDITYIVKLSTIQIIKKLMKEVVPHMEITDVKVRKMSKEGKMKAIVSISLDNEFVIHDIKVIEGEKGFFIAMPSRKTTNGDFRDIAHPISSAAREKMQIAILEKYETTAYIEEAAASEYIEDNL